MAEQIPSEFLFEFLKVFGLSREVQYVFCHREYMKMYAYQLFIPNQQNKVLRELFPFFTILRVGL